jgi:hypothetical protein
MPFQLNDATAGTQRLQFDNSGNTEFGPATPNSPLSFQGRPLLDSSAAYLASQVARPAGMPRLTGAVNVTAGSTVDVGCPQGAGFGSVDGEAGISAFNSDRTVFTVFPYFNSGSRTIGYAVL